MSQTSLLDQPRKYVQVREYVRDLVAGAAPGSAAPSERELVQLFSVARMTVRQAIDALVSEGLLRRVPGRGTFVAQPPRVEKRILGWSETLARRGIATSSLTLAVTREQAGPGVARALAVSEGASIVHWSRVRHAEGQPVAIQDSYLLEDMVPGLLRGVRPGSLYAELEQSGLRPTWIEDSFSADLAAPEEAGYLGVQIGSPVLRKQRRAVSGDRPVEVSRGVFRTDRLALWVQVSAHD